MHWLAQGMLMLTGGVLLFLFGLFLFVFAFRMAYANKIYPGVSVADIDLSGLRSAPASDPLAENVRFPREALIGLQYDQRTWIARPDELGLVLNRSESIQQALKWGRQGDILSQVSQQFEAWYFGVNLPPVYVLDERVAYEYLKRIAAEIDKPTIEASLVLRGMEVIVQPAQEGRSVDIPATLIALRAQLIKMQSGFVPMAVLEQKPAVMDVSAEADIARRILSAPLNLSLPNTQPGDAGPWQVKQQDLAQMLVVQRISSAQGDQYQVKVDVERLRPLLQDIASKVTRSPQDARYIFNDETRQLDVIQPAIVGRNLVVEKTLQSINEQLRAGQHNVAMALDITNPRHTDKATAEEMGITELISSYTSYFYGSDAGRIQNITTAASHFHGVLVAPGETFSMASVMGSVDLDNGYAEAWIIYGDRTIKGVGGGVCQVSTTLFRTAFFGGFPIAERHPHAYRVSYYEYTAGAAVDPDLAGLDATVFVPVVDFKFTNDSPYWILMETYVNASARTLTWKFYSTPDGRNVEWQTSGLTNLVDPPAARYIENAELPAGEIKQVDWAVQGADVAVTRSVYKNGQFAFNDEFTTHYMPWADAFEYGPGTELPNLTEE